MASKIPTRFASIDNRDFDVGHAGNPRTELQLTCVAYDRDGCPFFGTEPMQQLRRELRTDASRVAEYQRNARGGRHRSYTFTSAAVSSSE